jgi:hypothetical protein
MVSYRRFAEPQIKIVSPMAAFPHFRLESCAGISFIDSTPIRKSGCVRRLTKQLACEG